jgi:hypothetical protein
VQQSWGLARLVAASKRVRRTYLHFGVPGHGEAVHAVGDDSQAGGDQECPNAI